jgi:hypothetical protein
MGRGILMFSWGVRNEEHSAIDLGMNAWMIPLFPTANPTLSHHFIIPHITPHCPLVEVGSCVLPVKALTIRRNA